MENQEQVQPRRSQRQRKFVEKLQLDFRRRRDSKPIDYRKQRRQRKEKRKRENEEKNDSQNLKSKKAKIQDDQKKDNNDAAGKPICAICAIRSSGNFCEIRKPGVPTKKFRTFADYENNIFYY
jgi:hypothetical protein